MTTPRPNRWSMTIGGTLPFRKPGMFTDLAMAAYALSMLGLKSANGTSTVIFTRVGLNCSTVLGTLGHFLWSGASGRRREAAGRAQMSLGNLTGGRTHDQPARYRTLG